MGFTIGSISRVFIARTSRIQDFSSLASSRLLQVVPGSLKPTALLRLMILSTSATATLTEERMMGMLI
jgi:hypothetical protein